MFVLVPSDKDSGSNVKMSGPEILKYRLIYLLTRNMSCDVAAYLVLYSLRMNVLLVFLPISMLITLRLGYEFLVILPIHRTVRIYRHQSFQVAHRRWQIHRWRMEVGRI